MRPAADLTALASVVRAEAERRLLWEGEAVEW
jgi:hypothetical protein